MPGDAFSAWGADRGLRAATGEVREATPALVRSGGAEVEPLLEGELAPGLEGTLCRLTQGGGGRGGRHALAVVTRVPETVAFAPALVCRDRAAFDAAPASLPAERWAEATLESQAFSDRYRLLALAGQDQGWLRELFSPALISWLGHDASPGLSWELNSGDLVVLVPGGADDAGLADRLVTDAAELARRLRAEAEEEAADPDLFDESAEMADIERALAEVPFDEAPESVQEAVGRFRRAASRKPAVLLRALSWAAAASAPVIVGVSLLAGWAAALAAALIVAIPAFLLGRLVAASRYRWGRAAVPRAGLEAFAREYGRSRGLVLEDRWAFHAAHRHVPLPGFADHVFRGRHPGLDRDALFLLLADAGEMRSRGTEVAFTAERPWASNALLVRLDSDPSDRRLRELPVPDGYRVSATGRELLVWREVPGNLIRTAAGSDRFRARAAELAAKVAD
jgi:hypothetical protein